MTEEPTLTPASAQSADARPRRGLAPAAIAQAGALIALTAVGAQVTLAIGPVPFTMQILVVALCALVCTPGQAALAMGGYALLGGLGLPVFSAMRGGLAVLAGPTGGYIYGYILTVALGALLRRSVCPPAARSANAARCAAADATCLVVTVLVCYAVGTAHFMAVSALAGSSVGLGYVLGVCVVPFILPDVLKCVAAAFVAAALRRAVPSVAVR